MTNSERELIEAIQRRRTNKPSEKSPVADRIVVLVMALTVFGGLASAVAGLLTP